MTGVFHKHQHGEFEQMRRLFPTLLLALTCCAVSPLSGAPVQVIKTVRDNPTLYAGEISGPPAFVSALRSYLGACGWFDLTGTPRAVATDLTASA